MTRANWTDNYNGTGVAGRIVKSNVEGYKDKSIFLPAAGLRNNADLYNTGANGHYWSSSLNTAPHNAKLMYFDSSLFYMGTGSRYSGHSVRPVCD